jgi:predicted anti-sigma-YlaC factor YlaD
MSNAELDKPCAEWRESLALRSAGVLTPDERVAVQQHVANCPACSIRAGEYEGLTRNLRGLVPETANRPVLARLSQATAWEVRPESRMAYRHRVLRYAGLAAALLLLASVAWWGRGPNLPQPGDFGPVYTTTTDVRPATPSPIKEPAAPSSAPTWGELSLALTRSDDPLDDLLVSSRPAPVTTHTHPVLTPRSLLEDL